MTGSYLIQVLLTFHGRSVHGQYPPMAPHSFQNLDSDVAELVVIFPTNVWEYDVLDYFPFSTPEAKAMAEEARKASEQAGKKSD